MFKAIRLVPERPHLFGPPVRLPVSSVRGSRCPCRRKIGHHSPYWNADDELAIIGILGSPLWNPPMSVVHHGSRRALCSARPESRLPAEAALGYTFGSDVSRQEGCAIPIELAGPRFTTRSGSSALRSRITVGNARAGAEDD